MNWKGSMDSVLNMQNDILFDIYCWQQVILDRMASAEALANGCSLQEVLEVWTKLKVEIRKDLIEQLYSKHGPDLSADLGLG